MRLGIENTGELFVAMPHRQHHVVSVSPVQKLHRHDRPRRWPSENVNVRAYVETRFTLSRPVSKKMRKASIASS